jgi:hypothetical protein
MASRGWAKNKKGHLVNSGGKTRRQVLAEKKQADKNFEMASRKLESAKKSKNPEEKKNAELLFQAAKRDKLDRLSPEKTGVGIILSSDKPKPNTFVKATVVIPTMGRSRNDPPNSMEIQGKVLGDYIVHRSKRGFTGKYQVTHIKSGLAVTWKKDLKLNTEKDGQEIVRKLIKSDVKMPSRFNTQIPQKELGKMIADINKAVES